MSAFLSFLTSARRSASALAAVSLRLASALASASLLFASRSSRRRFISSRLRFRSSGESASKRISVTFIVFLFIKDELAFICSSLCSNIFFFMIYAKHFKYYLDCVVILRPEAGEKITLSELLNVI